MRAKGSKDNTVKEYNKIASCLYNYSYTKIKQTNKNVSTVIEGHTTISTRA